MPPISFFFVIQEEIKRNINSCFSHRIEPIALSTDLAWLIMLSMEIDFSIQGSLEVCAVTMENKAILSQVL